MSRLATLRGAAAGGRGPAPERLSNARRLVRLLDERDPEQAVEGGGEAELLAELVPLMEGRGCDAGDVRALLGR